ncbi:MAG: rod shape-determining protein MreC [Firmicutes bacterium]|nr:rod shape-determining protein MreC [Bacillota bacterium]
MRHYFSTKVKVVLVLAVILTAGLAVTGSLTGLTVGEMFVQGVLTPLRTGASALTAQAERFYDYLFRYEALEAENTALKEELAQMRDDALAAESVQRENDRLRALLELKEEHEDYQLVDAYIISWSSSDFSSTCTINRGTSSGIETGMCAITESGEVVGLVTEAGSNYAVIRTILDSSLEISAIISSSGYSGMVSGSYVTGEEGLLRMDYLSSAAIIRNNDQVVTAGSTVYPRNLTLGYIVDAGFNDSGVSKYAILEPAADISSLEQVFILTDFSTE